MLMKCVQRLHEQIIARERKAEASATRTRVSEHGASKAAKFQHSQVDQPWDDDVQPRREQQRSAGPRGQRQERRDERDGRAETTSA